MTTHSETQRTKAWDFIPATGPILSIPNAARYLGLTTDTYYRLARLGYVPPPLKIGIRASGVPQGSLDALIAHRACVQEQAA